MAVVDRLKKAWNTFRSIDESESYFTGGSSSFHTAKPDRSRRRYFTERTIVSSIYTRISIDVAGIVIRHVELDSSGRYSDDVAGPLNDALLFEPNKDQGPRAFRQDIVASLIDEGVIAIVPVDTSVDPKNNEIFDIYTLRVGSIRGWEPNHISVDVYNEVTGQRETVRLHKRYVAIVENPLHSVMNEPNSTLQRLIRKLNLLDDVDEASSSGKLDLIIQLPYVIKSDARRQQAEQRREDIEFQLKGSKYGIAYTDATEKVIQLNRPAENTLLTQVEYLTNLLYSQLGLTEEIMNGTGSEQAMLNYHNRTIEPIIDAIAEGMQRAFLGLTRIKRDERIMYFRDPFKLVPVGTIAEIGDKFIRNEILTSNEVRGFIGVPPSPEAKADKLNNPNMPDPEPTTEALSDDGP